MQLKFYGRLIHKLYNWEFYIFLILDSWMLFEVMGDLKQASYQRKGSDMLLQIKCDKLHQKIYLDIFTQKTCIWEQNPYFQEKMRENLVFGEKKTTTC